MSGGLRCSGSREKAALSDGGVAQRPRRSRRAARWSLVASGSCWLPGQRHHGALPPHRWIDLCDCLLHRIARRLGSAIRDARIACCLRRAGLGRVLLFHRDGAPIEPVLLGIGGRLKRGLPPQVWRLGRGVPSPAAAPASSPLARIGAREVSVLLSVHQRQHRLPQSTADNPGEGVWSHHQPVPVEGREYASALAIWPREPHGERSTLRSVSLQPVDQFIAGPEKSSGLLDQIPRPQACQGLQIAPRVSTWANVPSPSQPLLPAPRAAPAAAMLPKRPPPVKHPSTALPAPGPCLRRQITRDGAGAAGPPVRAALPAQTVSTRGRARDR